MGEFVVGGIITAGDSQLMVVDPPLRKRLMRSVCSVLSPFLLEG